MTGASGLLGSYLLPLMKEDYKVTTLQRHDAEVECDLASSVPDLSGHRFDLVVHAAGSCAETDALAVNLEGTRHLLQALEGNPPSEFVYLSSWEVYSPDAGEGVDENKQLWASTKCGQSKALAEKLVGEWCADHDVLLTVLRPARMLGKGVKGEMRSMFNDVVNSRYIHIRDNEARLSLVCASDVAAAIKKLHSIGGIYNVSDGRDPRWIDLAEAMSANCGAMKRQTFLPAKWAAFAWRVAPWIPAVKASLRPETLARRSKTLTLSDAAIRNALREEWQPFAAIEVLSRTCKDYPYLD